MDRLMGRKDTRARRYRWRRLGTVAAILSLTLAAMGLWWSVQATAVSSPVRLVRLHVVPHSDSPVDQRLKLAVRDGLASVAVELMNDAERLADTEVLEDYIYRLRATASNVLAAHGAVYPVVVDVQRTAGGQVAALRVVIGEGRGANWFCVLVPPLCFADLAPVETVLPADDEPGQGGLRIGWKWLGRWLEALTLPFEGVGDVDQDDIHTDFAHATPRDGDVGLAGE